MLQDTMDGLEPEELEEESEQEVEKILNEIVKDEMQRAPKAQKGALEPAEDVELPGTSMEETEESMDQMRARLEALRSW